MAHSPHKASDTPTILNGYQLLDALNCIAPKRNAVQMSTKICIHRYPTSDVDNLTPTDVYCWLVDYPAEGSIKLIDKESSDHMIHPLPQDFVNMVNRLIEAARWVCTTPSARKQPDALALAKVILHLTCPVIDAYHAEISRSMKG